MMRKLFLCLIAISCFLISCEKDPEAVDVPSSHIPVVEGFYAMSVQGVLMGIYGEPNTLNESKGYVMTHPFPNPTYNFSHIVLLEVPPTFTKGKFWIVPALEKGQLANHPTTNGGQFAIAGGVPVASGVFFKQSNLTTINFYLPPGTYRVYVLCDNVLLYDNLIVQQLNQ